MSALLLYVHLSSLFLIVIILSLFFFIWWFISSPSLPRETLFFIIHSFPIYFKSFLLFPLHDSACVSHTLCFYCICSYFLLVQHQLLELSKVMNTQRQLLCGLRWCQQDVSSVASESTFHSTDLLAIRTHKTNCSVVSRRYSSCNVPPAICFNCIPLRSCNYMENCCSCSRQTHCMILQEAI